MSEEKKMVTIRAAGQTREFAKGSSCREIAEVFQELYPNRILLARRNGKYLMELWKKVNEDCGLEFLTMKDKAGFDVYRRSVCFLMLKAVSNLCAGEDAHVWIRFAVSDGLFCTMRREITQESDLPIRVISASVGIEDATYFSKLFKKAVGVSPIRYREEQTRTQEPS